MMTADSHITIESLRCLSSEWAGAMTTTFAHHHRYVGLEIHVLHPQPDQLMPAHACVEQQHDYGRVPPRVEVLALAGLQQEKVKRRERTIRRELKAGELLRKT